MIKNLDDLPLGKRLREAFTSFGDGFRPIDEPADKPDLIGLSQGEGASEPKPFPEMTDAERGRYLVKALLGQIDSMKPQNMGFGWPLIRNMATTYTTYMKGNNHAG